MTNNLTYHPAALAEAEEARRWYAARSETATTGFLSELASALNAVSENPARFPMHESGVARFRSLQRYPFRVIYSFNATQVIIIAIAHTSRRPNYWQQRIN